MAIVKNVLGATLKDAGATLFTENLLRPIIPLNEKQQLELVTGLISNKYSKQTFKKKAETYQLKYLIGSLALLTMNTGQEWLDLKLFMTFFKRRTATRARAIIKE